MSAGKPGRKVYVYAVFSSLIFGLQLEGDENFQKTGNTELSTTTTREQNRALGRQVYGRYPNPGKDRKTISTIAFAGSAKIWAARWW